MEDAAEYFASGLLESRRRRVAVPDDVRECSPAAGLAGLRESRRSQRVRALGGKGIAHRSAVASRGIWHARGNGAAVSLGNGAPDRRFGNFDFESWDPTPVGAFLQGQSAFGVADLVGNGWEWTVHRVRARFPVLSRSSFIPAIRPISSMVSIT